MSPIVEHAQGNTHGQVRPKMGIARMMMMTTRMTMTMTMTAMGYYVDDFLIVFFVVVADVNTLSLVQKA